MTSSSDKNWMDKSVSYSKCPRCPTGQLDTRVTRGFIVKNLFFWLDMKRYKCNNCQAKVFVRNKPKK